MPSLAFATVQDADARSAAWWVAILGRDKYAEDVTAYLYSRAVTEQGAVSIEVPARDPHLDTLLRQDQMTAAEVTALVGLYPAYAVGTAYKVGDLCAYGGTLYKIVQAHTSQADWIPSSTPALYTGVAPAGVIPEWKQPAGAHDAYALNAQVTYQGKVWRSTINANVWAPGVYGWVQV